jgi:hypothetical protein
MWGLLLLLVVAAGLSYVAGGLQGHGFIWAYQVCSATAGLCDHPDWAILAAGCVGLAYFVLSRIRV